MLSILYLLVSAMALVPLSAQPGGVINNQYFSGVPKTVNDTTFPIDLKVKRTSDMVLVKCPGDDYRHTQTRDSFKLNRTIDRGDLKVVVVKDMFIWVPLMEHSSRVAHINCGELGINSGGNNRKFYEWSYNVRWENGSDLKGLIRREKMSVKISKPDDMCSEIIDDLLIFTTTFNNSIMMVDPKKEYSTFYTRQLFYLFLKPNDTQTDMINKPCGIVKAYYDCPDISLTNCGSYDKTKKINNIKINIVKAVEKEKVIEVKLDGGRDTNFYRAEKISITRMVYNGKTLEIIENSTKLITSEFKIKGFEVVRLSYNCLSQNNEKKIIETFYFAPTSEDHKINQFVKYDKNDSTIQPNCSVNWMTVGYLEKIKYKGSETSLKDIENGSDNEGILKKGGNFVFLKVGNEHEISLECSYRTPAGTITTVTRFVNGTKVLKGYNTDGTPIFDYDITNKQMKNEIEQLKRSWYQKLVDSCGKIGAIFIIIGVFLLILLCIVVPLLVIYVKILSPCMKVRKYKNLYPNVYNFWESLTNESFEVYCNSIMDKKYLSDKVTNRKVIKKIEGGEEIDVGISDLFDSTLVACYKNMPKKIKAHYIYKDTEDRKYILSDALTKDTMYSFWQMVYDEDIGTIIAVIYDKKTGGNDQASNKIYWPEDKGTYEDISVKLLSSIKTNILSVFGYKFQLSKKSGTPKTIKIYHVSNWKENDIPQSDLQFFNLYEEIFKSSKHKNFLIHSSQGTGSRVYMLTYYACMYDAITSEKVLENPLFVIKKIRDKRYGGNIGAYEFAYVIKCLVTTLFKNKILIDMEKRHVAFISSYDDFLYNYMTRQAKMDPKLLEFLSYVNIIDSAKIDEYKAVFNGIGEIPQKDHPVYFKRFIEAAMVRVNRKTRYADIMCLDSTAITIKGKSKEDPESFIHANKFDYTTTDGRKRKLILCQAPLAHTRDDMLDMIFRHKVSIIVVLVKPEEADHKWIPYFPVGNEVFATDNYTVTKSNEKAVDKNHISESEYFLDGKRGEGRFKFTILHYRGWPDKSIPSEHMSIYALYKRIISFGSDDYIAIHCSAGIGRTGTLALIMYLIDTVNFFPTFNPLARLLCIRQHRYGAVQKFNQFVFALLVVFEHFKKQIDMMDPGAYKRLNKMAQNAFKKEMN
uniref:Tyrosine-protein phosphatase domain-containing protein n=1 Tax=Strongyloides papillosus TaxID=174720 RepID=A0A0N5BTF7_STREA